MRYLKMFCRWAMKGKLIRELPYSVVMLKEDKRARPIVEKDQREAFMGAVTRLNPQIPAAATFTMMLGVREAEMLNSRWEWLTTEIYDVRSKTKSKKHRVISVPPILHTTLGWMLTYQALARKEELPVQRPQTGLIFPGGGGKPHSRGWLNKALKRGAVAIGASTLGIHRLRGTFATLHLRKNTPLKEVQEMMGHWSAVTTLGYQETSTVEQKKHQDELWGD
jgi:integrase